MKLWIVTIGSSDVQLDSDKASREKRQKKNKSTVRKFGGIGTMILNQIVVTFLLPQKTAFPDIEETYRIKSRVLGTVYEENSTEIQDEIWSYLTFPLLSNFSQRLKSLGVPDAIAYLVTDPICHL